MGATTDRASEPTQDRNRLRILDEDECYRLLDTIAVGRVAFILAGRPMVLPVAHALDGDTIVFRTGVGSKLATSQREIGVVAFEVDRWDDSLRTGASVLVQGTMDPVLDITEKARLDGLGLPRWLDAARPHWVRITIERLSGRALEHAQVG